MEFTESDAQEPSPVRAHCTDLDGSDGAVFSDSGQTKARQKRSGKRQQFQKEGENVI